MWHRNGFTLIELMIVVVVVAILSAVAYPSYTNYVKRANRSAAQQLMLNIASREEQYLLDARAYTGALNSTGLNISTQDWTCSATACSNSFYDISVSAPGGTPPSYSITATAKGSQLSDGNLGLTNTGVKTPANKWN